MKDLEARLKRKFPEPLSRFLTEFGFLQDLLPGFPTSPAHFIELSRPHKVPWICIVNGETDLLLRGGDPRGALYEFDSEEAKRDPDYVAQPLAETLDQLIDRQVTDLLKNPTGHLPNNQKVWFLQHSVRTPDEDGLLRFLNERLGWVGSQEPWRDEGRNPNGMRTESRRLWGDGRTIRLARLTHPDWGTPEYVADQSAGLDNLEEIILARQAIGNFETLGDTYKVVDHGIMPAVEVEARR